MKALKIIGILTVFLANQPTVSAQNKVVIIPLSGNDVAMAEQHFHYDESADAQGGDAIMCESEEFATPAQATQVIINAQMNGNLTSDGTLNGSSRPYWELTVEFNKDGAGYLLMAPGFRAWAAVHSHGWSQITTMKRMDLSPNSTYQFRLRGKGQTGDFLQGSNQYCEMLITASYKLPEGEAILQVTP